LVEGRYEEWAEIRRQELEGEFLSLLVELATLDEERGEYIPAIDTLKRVLFTQTTRLPEGSSSA
jgi:hypothetical protein